jgi:hypothetical protein
VRLREGGHSFEPERRRLARDLDQMVEAFRSRPLDAGP